MTHVDAFRLSVNPLSRLPISARLRSSAHPAGKGCCWPRCCCSRPEQHRPPVPRCRGKVRCNPFWSRFRGRWRASSRSSSSSPRARARLRRHVGRLSQADPDCVRPVHRLRGFELLPVVLLVLRRGRRMSTANDLPGFEVPMHRSLTEPLLMGGAPRTVAIANGTLAAAVGLGLQLWIPGVVLWIVGHSLAVWGARVDPQFMQVFARHIATSRCWTCEGMPC